MENDTQVATSDDTARRLLNGSAPTYAGRMANYVNSTIVEMPEELCKRTGHWPGFKMRQIGSDVWVMTGAPALRLAQLRTMKGLRSGYLGVTFAHHAMADGLFGMSPTEFVWMDNEIIATVTKRLPLHGRGPAEAVSRLRRSPLVPPKAVAAASEAVAAATAGKSGSEHLAAAQAAEKAYDAAVAAAKVAEDALKDPPPPAKAAEKVYDAMAAAKDMPLIDRMRAILSNTRYVEGISPYRLVKSVDGKWVFSAPTIE